MDRVCVGLRVDDKSKIGGTPAASMWINTKTVIFNGPNHMDVFRNQKRFSNVEAVNWECTRLQEKREWISEISLVLRESKILEALNSKN